LFKIVDDDFFKNIFVSRLFRLTKSYYTKFNTLPFDLENPTVDQIKEIATRNVEKVITDAQLDKEENLDAFVTNTEHIISSNYKRYDPKWIVETVNAWIEWENQQKGFRLSIEYQKTVKVTPENVKEVIKKSRDIINSRSNVIVDEDDGVDFDDPEAHKQIDPKDLVNTGYKNLNLWLSGKPSGGFEPATLSLFIAEPNIGKSIWLGNLALNMMMNGFNVLLISLEMATYKIYRRLGSNAFGVEMNKYSDFANDTAMVTNFIKEFKERNASELYPIGKLRSKKFTKATPSDIEGLAKRLEIKLGIKWHAIVIDYLTEMDNSYGISSDKSYYYHKQNANDLYSMAGNNYWAAITAHQIGGQDFGGDDLTLQSLAESKGLAHRPDNIFGIIQPPTMKIDNKFHLKNIKSRDGEYKNFKLEYAVNYKHMRLSEYDMMIEPNTMILP
jgi:hypothetical protein